MTDLHPDLARVLISPEEIHRRVKDIAAALARDYEGQGNLYLVGILKGAFIFLADLARQLTHPHYVDFMALSSYGRTTVSQAVRILMDLREPVAARHVIIVEDIVDSGNTLSYLRQMLLSRQPASLKTCVLLRKTRPGTSVDVDYLGFDIPNVWVVGYGLDYAEAYRTLPFIAELRPEVYRQGK